MCHLMLNACFLLKRKIQEVVLYLIHSRTRCKIFHPVSKRLTNLICKFLAAILIKLTATIVHFEERICYS
jgi:hypothetical protein